MKENVRQTYKSGDTEEWLDRVWTRPIGYLWARLFMRLGMSPNAVTVLSMLIGASSACFFAHGSYRTEGTSGLLSNVVAILMLMWANFLDSADGQLARMTGKKTQLGRILDGAASEVWFIPIYCALVWRFYQHHQMEFGWLGLADTAAGATVAALLLFAVVLYSGFHCHAGQCALADYYRQIHLFFLQGKAGSELDHSAQQQRLYDATPWRLSGAGWRQQAHQLVWKAFLFTYVGYTRRQERQTPCFQMLICRLRTLYGSIDRVPQAFRNRFRRQSLPLMPLTNILTFNTRAFVLYACCLADIPWLYFVFEVIVMSALCEYMRRRHERFCQVMTAEV